MGYLDYAGLQYLWGKLKEKFAPKSHSHDDRYYTEAEIDGKLTEKLHEETITDARDLNTIKTTGVYHLKTTSYTNGPGISNHATIFVDYTVGTPYQIFIPDSVNRAWRRNHVNSNDTWSAWTELKYTDTNTWRGIQNNLTSDSTDQSLSAAQGKALKALVDGKAPTSHKHTKSQITDFPSSMPASDVYAWAKAATKPSYTKAEVGLSNVDNTADKDKSVKYAASAGSATTGLNGVSTCLFDSSSNNGSCVRFYNGLQICFGNSSKSSGVVFKLPFANDNYAVVVGGSDTLKNAWYVAGSRTTTGFNPNQNGFAVLFHWIAIGNWK